ncbi:hypothetical protein CerSpe_236740 [Prunus speciosa]
MAQLGWIAGPIVMVLFSFITYYTSTLLAAFINLCSANFKFSGALQVKFCGSVQNMTFFGISTGNGFWLGLGMYLA